MNFKILIVTLALACYGSAALEIDSQAETKHDAAVPAPTVLTADIKKDVTVAVDTPKGKSSLESKPAPESITLYRHDQNAGVYRTDAGDLVRMYRVEPANGPSASRRTGPGRRAVPKRDGPGEERAAERQRMFGDWFSNYYSPYGGGLGSYSYNYNYNYPYNYGSYYNPYSSYYNQGYYNQGYYPYYGGMGMYGY